jgi:hypothetical protein
MEREQWRWVVWALKRLPRRSPRRGVYDNTAILAVLLWAAMHDRSILWACRRSSWPVQAWRRRLPDQSTMSRRLRDPLIQEDLELLVAILQRRAIGGGSDLIVDGKPLAVSEFTADPEAITGWGAGRHAKGYKLHALIDDARRLMAWEVRPMKDSEQAVACDLVKRAAAKGLLPRGATLLGDANYDSRHLYAAAADAGIRLIAPRRTPGAGICQYPPSHEHRIAAITLLEQNERFASDFKQRRAAIERYFGTLATIGGGLHALPAWARRMHRVRSWVGAKLVLFTARSTALDNELAA